MSKSKYSAVQKAWALETGNYALYCKARGQLFRENHIDFLHSDEYWAHLNIPDYDVCRCLWRAKFARGYRLRKRLQPMIAQGAWFVTLTFRDAVLNSTSPATRRVYVREYLKGLCLDFVANKDFGKDFCREHYHAVISLVFDESRLLIVHDNKGAHASLDWDYGYSNWERIGMREDCSDHLKQVSKYLSKLQNHALKETASKEVMIFSRSKRK